MSSSNELMVLIDGHAMLYRAFFAFPQTLTKADGMIVNAVYGFSRMLLTTIAQLQPTHMMVSFDVGKTFRHEQYPEYKAHREKMPEELKLQEPLAFDVVKALNMPLYLKDGYEADDVLGTLAMKASGRHGDDEVVDVMIVTGDMDALQLVRDPEKDLGFVKVYNPGGGRRTSKTYDEAGVIEKLGLRADQVPDMKGLSGDSSDNIPGIKGIGPKTAQKLLNSFETLEGVYEVLGMSKEEVLRLSGGTNTTRSAQDDTSSIKSLEEMSKDERRNAGLQPSVIQKLKDNPQIAFESRELATIVTDIELPFTLSDARVQAYDKQKASDVFAELEFESLLKLLPEDAFESDVQDALF